MGKCKPGSDALKAELMARLGGATLDVKYNKQPRKMVKNMLLPELCKALHETLAPAGAAATGGVGGGGGEEGGIGGFSGGGGVGGGDGGVGDGGGIGGDNGGGGEGMGTRGGANGGFGVEGGGADGGASATVGSGRRVDHARCRGWRRRHSGLDSLV